MIAYLLYFCLFVIIIIFFSINRHVKDTFASINSFQIFFLKVKIPFMNEIKVL